MASLCRTQPHLNYLYRLVRTRTTECRPQHPSRLILSDWEQRYYSIKIPSASSSSESPPSTCLSSVRIPARVASATANSLGRSPSTPPHTRKSSYGTIVHGRNIRPSNRALSTASTPVPQHYGADDETDSDARRKTTGQECYDRAIGALRTRRVREDEAEERAAKEQYDAMERSFRKSHDRDAAAEPTRVEGHVEGGGAPIDVREAKKKKRGQISANVAIVRTITRQTRNKKKQELKRRNVAEEEEDEDNNTPNDDLVEEAQRYMQYAAFVHGHGDALVRLGNAALEDARRQPSDGASGDGGGGVLGAAQRMYGYVSPGHGGGVVVDVEELRSMPSSMDRALRLYRLAGERGSKEGWYNYGHLLWGIAHSNEGEGDATGEKKKDAPTEQDSGDHLFQSLQAFRNAMELGDGDAAYFLGVQYLLPSEDEALSNHLVELEDCESLLDLKLYGLKLIQRAGNKYNHGGALYYTALLHRNGDEELGITPCTTEEFSQHLDRAANCGDADALFLRAYCLYNGEDGYSQDYSKALDGFIQSGEAGNADGFVSAGAMLHRGGYGTAVQQDQRRAFEFYQEAAEMDSTEAWRNLVACYALGEGIPKCEQTSQYIAKTMLNDDGDSQ